MSVSQYGRTEPRIWTKPLHDLTPETSLGFEVVDFARHFLKIELRPWQQWLLIHALELKPDGTYRFRRVIVLVARQNGKTLLASVLAAWWLFADSARHPDRVPPVDFKIVGTAQNLDIAREPWSSVKLWCDPEPDTDAATAAAIPALQDATAKVSDTNGKEFILAESLAHYEIRAAKNARGKPAARVLMDELREQQTWVAWNAVSQTTKSFWSGQLWGISNAGSAASIVLAKQREAALELIDEWERLVESTLMDAEAYASANHDTSIGIFEWSAPDGCALDDVDGILQANPSIGYGGITVASCISDSRSMPDADYRTEVLCQWVTAQVDSYVDVSDWKQSMVSPFAVKVPKGSRTVWGVDVSFDRRWTWISVATFTEDGVPFVQLRERHKSMFKAVDRLAELADESGFREVALQSRGSPSMELVQPLTEKGLTVHEIDGGHIGLATGRFRDRVRSGELAHTEQPLVDLAIEGGLVKTIAENEAWDRRRSVVDIGGVVAETVALYGLEALEPEDAAPAPPPPPAAAVVARHDTAGLANLATAQF
ncbi:terminase [Changpingibacter yushuensis]|uniref:terminase n=1 Tax=Changpingibacter yushuensis TaxID=2758440 RepID=UPI00165D919E|nr:terminase [Changpingibacter yushuensis]